MTIVILVTFTLIVGLASIAAVIGGNRKEAPRKDASAKMEE